MITAAAVATLLGISPRAVYDLADRGMLACYRFGVRGGAVRFDEADVAAYKARLATPPAWTPPMLSASDLRKYEQIRKRAAEVGYDAPRLTEHQQAIADSRYRRLVFVPWADRRAARAIYAEAKRLTAETGVAHHVDHIIPLQGDFVSGLHVETNMRVITGSDNSRKRNKFTEEDAA